jgi:hypothetical protein
MVLKLSLLPPEAVKQHQRLAPAAFQVHILQAAGQRDRAALQPRAFAQGVEHVADGLFRGKVGEDLGEQVHGP